MAGNGRKKLETIGQQTIVDQIINTLTESIIRGDYKSGSKLPSEFELMEEMQVSRNSLREAMKILATMGIVEIKRGDGTYICSQVNPTLFDRLVYSMIYDVSSSDELLELRQILDTASRRQSRTAMPECALGRAWIRSQGSVPSETAGPMQWQDTAPSR